MLAEPAVAEERHSGTGVLNAHAEADPWAAGSLDWGISCRVGPKLCPTFLGRLVQAFHCD